jgi:hypothetical protein
MALRGESHGPISRRQHPQDAGQTRLPVKNSDASVNPVHQLVDEIRRYLEAHPEACDTLEGVSWWLNRPDLSAQEIAAALDLLVKSREVERLERSSGIYFRAVRP